MKDLKSLSLIIPSYNYGRYLAKAIDSVLKQSILPDEIIIVNDGSIDNTEHVALEYQSSYPELIKYISNSQNIGIVKTFNKAIALSQGDYVCILGADNMLGNNYLEMCKKALDQNEKLAVAYTDYLLFGSNAKKVYESHYEYWRAGEAKLNNDEIGLLISFPEWDSDNSINELGAHNFIHGSSMFRREAFDQVGGYLEPSEGAPEDWNLFLRMVSNGWEAVKVQEVVLEYRQHSDDQANIKSQKEQKAAQFDEVIAHWQKDVEELRGEIRIRDEIIEKYRVHAEAKEKEVNDLNNILKSPVSWFKYFLTNRH